MGTNYYLHEKPPCKCCGRSNEPLHIGKSSGGWCFALHVIPEECIDTLDDWRERWNQPESIILDEYGGIVSVTEMERIITCRVWKGNTPMHHEDNRCVGHGEGSWDYITGEFS